MFASVATTAPADKFDLETQRKDAIATAKWSAHHRAKVFEDAPVNTVVTEIQDDQETTDSQVNQVSPVGQVLLVQLELEDPMVKTVEMENAETWVKKVLMDNKVYKVRGAQLVQTGKAVFQVAGDEQVQQVYKEVLAKMENRVDQELSVPEDRQVFQEKLVNKATRVNQVYPVLRVNQEFKADEEISETLFKLLRAKKVFRDLWDHPVSTEKQARKA